MDIKENQKNHSNAMSYEFFLNRAFKYDKRLNRPNKSELINLIKAENGNGPTFLPNFEKQLDKSIFSYSLFSNKYLTGAITLGLLLMAAAIYLPGLQALFATVSLPVNWVLGIALIGLINILLIEVAKWLFRRFENK